MNFTLTPYSAITLACALVALTAITIVWATTHTARARAAERARIWGELKRPDLEARAARKRASRASGERADVRLRIALMSAVALVALAATNLSAHATIIAMQRVGLHSVDTAISAVIVFEAWLAILGALSLRHMTKGEGFNRYEAGVWAMASLMGVIAWWGGDSPIFALWPLLAAVAWHVVITFGRPHKQSALVTWWRLKRGKATTQDATTVVTERLINRIVNHGHAANVGPKLLRSTRSRAFDRAWAEADALGILTPEVRARIQTRMAARYVGARALAPEAVAHMNPWNERAQSARTVRAVRPVSAPPAHTLEVSAHEDHTERAPEDARTLVEPSAHDVGDLSATDLVEAIDAHFKSADEKAKTWAKEYAAKNGTLPTGEELAPIAGKAAATCRRWMAPVRLSLGLS